MSNIQGKDANNATQPNQTVADAASQFSNQGQTAGASQNTFNQQQQQNGFNQNQGQPQAGQSRWRNWSANRISRSTAVEAVNKFMESAKKIIEANGAASEYKLALIPTEYTQIQSAAVIALYKTAEIGGAPFTVVRTIIFATEQIPSRKVKIGGSNNGFGYNGFGSEIEIESAAGDVYSEHLWNAVQSYLTTQCRVIGKIVDAAALGLPHHFQSEDAQVTSVISGCATMIESYFGLVADPDNVHEVTPDMFEEGRTQARLDFNPKPVFDTMGNPIRADWAVQVAFTPNGANQQNQMDFTNAHMPIVNVFGYVDLVVNQNAMNPMGGMMNNGYGMNMMQQHPYVPMIIITHLETHLQALTPGIVLLGLHAMTAIADNQMFTRVFRPKANPKINRTIAAVGLEFPMFTDTKEPAIINLTSDDTAFFQLIGMAVSPNPLIAIDVQETGDNNTIMQIFRLITSGNQQAINMFIRSANIITNNQFGVVASRNQLSPQAVAQSDNNRIALGNYAADGSNIYDRREVDHLAMLTILGATDQSTVRQYDETLNNLSLPLEVRMATNWQIVNNVLGSTNPPTGYARRIILSGKFLATNNEAFRSVVNVQLDNAIYDGKTQRGRDYASIQSMQYTGTNGFFQANNGWNGFNNNNLGARMGW